MSEVRFRAVQREALWSEAAEQIRSLIEQGILAPGTRLPGERELSQRLGISRLSLREAIRSLQYAGYLQVVPGRGTFVRDVREIGLASLDHWLRQHDDLVNKIFEFRELFEPGVAALAAERATSGQLAALRRTIEAMREAAAVGDLDAAIAADAEFHHQLVALTQNDLVTRFLAQLLRSIGEERRASLNIPGQVQRAIAGHQAIYEAIERRDAEEASRLMREHLRDARRYIQAWLEGNLDPVTGELRQ
ncbi:MAG: FadR family transcriptional regulator [Thermomicrobium sp.]|nr:FadR family transcriptional regulator [Thermomicrobium sp.]MDW7983003.1 FadR/GntR family transcriptional regulator [Thermomicrobium sp.]MDW8060150.1 FadR/GntR family transcriptional regulator [Thermomicrobium sp.]